MKKVVPKLRQKVKFDIVTSDDIKIYYTGKFQDFTATYIIKQIIVFCLLQKWHQRLVVKLWEQSKRRIQR